MFKKVLAVLAATTLVFTGSTLTSAPQANAAEVVQQKNTTQMQTIFDDLNAYRASKGLPFLNFNPAMSTVAQSWADKMATSETLNFNTGSPQQFPLTSVKSGQTIGVLSGTSGDGFLELWTSGSRDTAVLNTDFNMVGIGVAVTTVNGKSKTWVVADFGKYNRFDNIPTYDSPTIWARLFPTSQPTFQHAEGAITSVRPTGGAGLIEVKGWALDYSAPTSASTVEVSTGTTRQVGTANLAIPGAPLFGASHGFTVHIQAKQGQTNRICVSALNTYGTGANSEIGCETVNVPAAQTRTITRLADNDRYSTSAAISRTTHTAGSVDTVYLASGAVFADALSAAPAAAQPGKALLLTSTNQLMPSVVTELKRLNPAKVILIGGPTTLTPAVVTATQQALPSATVTRIAGDSRYSTSIAIAKHAFPNPSKIYVVSGQKFPDALSAASVAAQDKAPIILVPSDGIPAVTQDYLRGAKFNSVIIAGGEDTISRANANEVDRLNAGVSAPKRVAGPDRWTTNMLLNAEVQLTQEAKVYIASGEKFPDALAAAAAAGKNGAPLLLSPSWCLTQSAKTRIDNVYKPNNIYILGGPDTLTPDVAALRTCNF